MKRHKIITRVIVFLLLGAIVNVAVAWGCALVGDYKYADGENVPTIPRAGASGFTLVHERCGSSFLVTVRVPESTYGSALGVQTHPKSNPSRTLLHFCNVIWDNEITYFEMTGWPLPALCWYRKHLITHKAMDAGGGPRRVGVCPTQTLAYNSVSRRMLPLQPLWFGFLVGTTFYGTASLVVYGGVRAISLKTREKWRGRRGRCASCGYDVSHATMGRCPECGAKR